MNDEDGREGVSGVGGEVETRPVGLGGRAGWKSGLALRLNNGVRGAEPLQAS